MSEVSVRDAVIPDEVVDAYRFDEVDDDFWHEDLFEMFTEDLRGAGVHIDTDRSWYCLSHCQRDGVELVGDVELSNFWNGRMGSFDCVWPIDLPLKGYPAIQKLVEVGGFVQVDRDGVEDYQMFEEVMVTDEDDGTKEAIAEAMDEKLEDELEDLGKDAKEFFRDLEGEFYRMLSDEWDHRTSDEVIREGLIDRRCWDLDDLREAVHEHCTAEDAERWDQEHGFTEYVALAS